MDVREFSGKHSPLSRFVPSLNLHYQVEEGALITVKNVSLSKAKFVKFRARSVDFLEVSNPRALLEVSLRKYTCLTVGDIICIRHGTKKFYMDVREVDPNGQASIIETDCNVDFEEPLGYKDSKYAQYEKKKQEETADSSAGSVFSEGSMKNRLLQRARADSEDLAAASASAKFVAFGGSAKRIDGKLTTSEKVTSPSSSSPSPTSTSSASANVMETEQPTSARYATASSSGIASSSSKGNESSNGGIAYQSKIGEKYSKKKMAVGAFVGSARKLAD